MRVPLQSLSQLPCSYEAENLTRYLLCDLGNPMKAGASVGTARCVCVRVCVCMCVCVCRGEENVHEVNVIQNAGMAGCVLACASLCTCVR